jgi:hypothetical protein
MRSTRTTCAFSSNSPLPWTRKAGTGPSTSPPLTEPLPGPLPKQPTEDQLKARRALLEARNALLERWHNLANMGMKAKIYACLTDTFGMLKFTNFATRAQPYDEWVSRACPREAVGAPCPVLVKKKIAKAIKVATGDSPDDDLADGHMVNSSPRPKR